MQELFTLAERVGVPAVIAFLALYRIETRLENLTTAIIDLAKNNRCPLTKEK